jgi:hypothetical protein
MYEADARAFLAEHDAHVRAAALAEAQDELVAWLVKKAREQKTWNAGTLASKVDRGAVRIFLEPAAMDARQAIRARALSDFLFLLRYSGETAAADKLLADHPELAELAARTETGDAS